MRRARETLIPLQEAGMIREVCFSERLREIDFGDFELKSFAEVARQGADLEGWLEYTGFSFPGGESIAAFTGRLRSMLDELRGHPAEELLVLTHGGVIRTMLCLLLGIDVKNYLLFRIDYGALCSVELYSDGGVLTGLNL